MTQAANDYWPGVHDGAPFPHAPQSTNYERPKFVKPSHRNALAHHHTQEGRPPYYDLSPDAL